MKSKNLLQDELFSAWEETYKKGQLTFWIFLALRDGAKYVSEIKQFIEHNSNGFISCEDQSLYRSMRKFTHLDMVRFETGKGHKGPDRKYYRLTEMGNQLLQMFIERQINLFYKPEIKNLIHNGKEIS
jgi:DNA-binding PadR family transcriptional regulator